MLSLVAYCGGEYFKMLFRLLLSGDDIVAFAAVCGGTTDDERLGVVIMFVAFAFNTGSASPLV